MTSSTPRHPTIGYVNLSVRDYAQALAFYRDVLGLPVLAEDGQFLYALFDAGGTRFAIVGGEQAAAQREARGAEFHTGIGFCVADVDAAHASLVGKGVRFTMPPSRQPWGGYMAMFADPDGNVFYLDTLR